MDNERLQKHLKKSPSWRREIDVKKTDIEAKDPRVRDDPPNWCIVHHTSHPIKQVQSLRSQASRRKNYNAKK